METPPSSSGPASAAPAAAQNGGMRCPACGGTVFLRIRRRLVDRIISWVRPVYRFRCDTPRCGWEGNFPQGALTQADPRRAYRR